MPNRISREPRSRVTWPHLALLSTALLLPEFAYAVDFDYQIERFEVSGNLPGDMTDEFDDGVMDWEFPVGTVTESNGALRLMSPGILDSDAYSNINPDIVLERSDASAPRRFLVADGAGDFAATSTWRNLPETPGGFYAMGVRHFLPIGVTEILSISVSSFDASTAAAFGRPAGLSITFSTVTFDIQTQALLTQDQESFAVAAPAIGNDTLLRLEFDDLADSLRASVSFDGGVTFRSPFAARDVSLDPASLFNSNGFILFADPAIVPEPSTALLLGIGLALAAARRLE